MEHDTRIIFVLGCTASGKSALGLELARRTGGEILSVDSMKVFRQMDVGTAKPSLAIQEEIPHHVLDVVDPWDEFSVAQYVELAERAVADTAVRGKPIYAVGGTALYIKALTEGLFEGPGADAGVRRRLRDEAAALGWTALHQRLKAIDPQAAQRIHVNDQRRIVRALEVYELTGKPISALQQQWDRERMQYDCVFIGIRRELQDANRRINERVRCMIEGGLLEEVRALLVLDKPLGRTARQALGYAEMIEHLQGKMPLDETIENVKINTRRFGKAQRTWFKRFRATHWLDAGPDTTAAQLADQAMEHL